MRLLVTGAAGLTGGEAVRVLMERGHAVLGVVRRSEQRGSVAASQVAVTDCSDEAAMESLLQTCDALLHVAGIHLGPALARLPSLRRLESVVVVSSAGIRSAHQASAAAYRAGEDAILAARPDAVIVRPTMIYGSARDRNVHRVIRFAQRYRFLPLFGDGRALLQPIHYGDLAAALAALLGSAVSEPLLAGGAAPLTVRRAGELIFEALRQPTRLVPIPHRPALVAAGAVDAVLGSRWQERIARTTEDRSVDIAALVALTGVRPREFAAGVRDEVREMLRSAEASRVA